MFKYTYLWTGSFIEGYFYYNHEIEIERTLGICGKFGNGVTAQPAWGVQQLKKKIHGWTCHCIITFANITWFSRVSLGEKKSVVHIIEVASKIIGINVPYLFQTFTSE